jgi:hypothetical protein
MRILVLSLASVLVFSSDLRAQSVTGAASGAVTGAANAGRGGVSANSALQGRGSVTVPSRPLSGSPRTVGPNFDARGGAHLDARVSPGQRGRLGASLDASGRAQLQMRGHDERQSADRRYAQQGRADAYAHAGEVNRHVLHADLQLAHRLAEIDRLRDHALAHDDVNLLMRADILEQQARVQHQRHVAQMEFAAERGQGQHQGFWNRPQWEPQGQFSGGVSGSATPYDPEQPQTIRPAEFQGAIYGPAPTTFEGQSGGQLYNAEAQGNLRGEASSTRRYPAPTTANAEGSAEATGSSATRIPSRSVPTYDGEINGQAEGQAQGEAQVAPRPTPPRKRN